ncbi:MAG: ATP-binding cassette domain-containing protein, partial [Aestuariivirgaceae bacterium]
MPRAAPILKVRDLRVRFRTVDGLVEAVRGASFEVSAGETLAVVGESGSGKSQMMMAVMGLLAQNGEADGIADYRGVNLLALPPHELNRIRGRKITMIFQEPMTSLDPLYTVGDQIIEPIIRHQHVDAAAARARALELLELVRIPHAERRLNSYPYELSGGQRQRVMIAMAIANDPDLLIADEPTTALDVTIQAEILALLADLQKRIGMAIVFITHDLGIVRRIADRVCVMRIGELVEQGPTEKIFAGPRHPYTKALLDAEPEGHKPPPPKGSPTILEGRRIRVSFTLGGGFLSPSRVELKAVDDVSISLRRSQTIGIVGESGSGKSTLARALLKLLPGDGIIRFMGRDLTHL